MSVNHSLYALLTTPQHYRRLFALDLNVQHFANENFKNIGKWFTNKYKTLTQRETSARDAFSRCRVTAATAREQWRLQVAAQTAAQPRTLKHPRIHLLTLYQEKASMRRKNWSLVFSYFAWISMMQSNTYKLCKQGPQLLITTIMMWMMQGLLWTSCDHGSGGQRLF
jgi:hypothetical protein